MHEEFLGHQNYCGCCNDVLESMYVNVFMPVNFYTYYYIRNYIENKEYKRDDIIFFCTKCFENRIRKLDVKIPKHLPVVQCKKFALRSLLRK